MKQNVGIIDARIRLVLAALLFGAALAFNSLPLIALAAALVALVLAGTALTRACPMYAILGLDTTSQRSHHP